jgi:hypothetical protein
VIAALRAVGMDLFMARQGLAVQTEIARQAARARRRGGCFRGGDCPRVGCGPLPHCSALAGEDVTATRLRGLDVAGGDAAWHAARSIKSPKGLTAAQKHRFWTGVIECLEVVIADAREKPSATLMVTACISRNPQRRRRPRRSSDGSAVVYCADAVA